MHSSSDVTKTDSHRGPSLVWLASIHAGLFLGGLVAVAILSGGGHIPSPYGPQEPIREFFLQNAAAVGIGGLLHFASAVPLGIYAATAFSRLRFLGIRAAGPSIALFGGFIAAAFLMITGLLQVLMSKPLFSGSENLITAFHWLIFGTGGPGLVVPLGLLYAGVSISAGLTKMIPKWLMYFGIALAVIAELSTFGLVSNTAAYLLPLARFLGFIWLIGIGLALPRRRDPAAI